MRVCGVLVSSVLCLVMTRLMMKMCLCCQASSCGFIPSQVPEVCVCVRVFALMTHIVSSLMAALLLWRRAEFLDRNWVGSPGVMRSRNARTPSHTDDDDDFINTEGRPLQTENR